ncbi:hypothetical protein K402DRAFT_397128 [Aulographum hederae CBS 113979]|uniref:Secreted protein n=1 Tax=Aulographum hederae CBS 113979 TaxID=1176131 RepID=A0A6G1GPT7_9PEZI|nr:hypothetical protein K402DRAFT_397128 [Aulographum hederae CBS 113979]
MLQDRFAGLSLVSVCSAVRVCSLSLPATRSSRKSRLLRTCGWFWSLDKHKLTHHSPNVFTSLEVTDTLEMLRCSTVRPVEMLTFLLQQSPTRVAPRARQYLPV